MIRFNFSYVVISVYKLCDALNFFLFALKTELRSIEISINLNPNWFLPAKGRVSTYCYIIEFQKRGLSHAHILIILHSNDHCLNANEINVTVNAEIPDQTRFFNLYIIVIRCIFYDNCNYYVISKTSIISIYWNSKTNKCNKRFPKDLCDHIVFESNIEYFIYRRNRSVVASENKFKINRWIMFYNFYLSIKYNAYINVKICVNVKACKYIFKYVYKSNDQVNFRIKQISENDIIKEINEIQKYRDARWMNSTEIC